MAVRLLANENVPRPAITALREAGHDVLWMLEDARGTVDSEVLARAQREHRVVTTFDKDFGELAFRDGAAATVGVVLFRITMTSPDRVARVAVAVFAEREDWRGLFAVVEDDRIRIRSLPAPRSES